MHEAIHIDRYVNIHMNNVIERVWIDISSMSVFRMYNFQFWGFFKEGITLEARIGKYIANLSSIFNLVKKILLREKNFLMLLF